MSLTNATNPHLNPPVNNQEHTLSREDIGMNAVKHPQQIKQRNKPDRSHLSSLNRADRSDSADGKQDESDIISKKESFNQVENEVVEQNLNGIETNRHLIQPETKREEPNKTKAAYLKARSLQEVLLEENKQLAPKKVDQSNGHNVPSAHLEIDFERCSLLASDSSDSEFSLSQFIEFFLYHVLFFILGPFAFLVLVPTAGMATTRNLGFFGFNSSFIQQSIQWSLIWTAIACWIAAEEPRVLNYAELIALGLNVLVRCGIIGAKYGSMPAKKIQALKTKVFSLKENFQEFALLDWRLQSESFVEEEIIRVIAKKNIDEATFFYNVIGTTTKQDDALVLNSSNFAKAKKDLTREFLVSDMDSEIPNKNPESKRLIAGHKQPRHQDNFMRSETVNEDVIRNQKLRLGIKEAIKANSAEKGSQFRSEYIKKLEEEERQDKLTKRLFNEMKRKRVDLLDIQIKTTVKKDMHPALGLCKQLIIYQNSKFSHFTILAPILGVLRAFLPLIVRASLGKPALGGTGTGRASSIFFIITNSYYWSANISFLINGWTDLRRRNGLLKKLHTLLTFRTTDVSNRKLDLNLMLNVFDYFSIKTWNNAFKVFLGYGERYTQRLNMNYNIFLLSSLTIFVITWLLNGLSLEITVLALMDAVCIGISLILVTWQSVQIKAQNNRAIFLLEDYCTMLKDLNALSRLYFPKQPSSYRPKNLLYVAGIRYIQQLLDQAGLKKGKQETYNAIEKFIFKQTQNIEEIKSMRLKTKTVVVFLGLQMNVLYLLFIIAGNLTAIASFIYLIYLNRHQ